MGGGRTRQRRRVSDAHVRAHLFEDGRAQDFACNEETLAELLSDRRPGRFLWLHIAGTEGRAEELGALPVALPPSASQALLAYETRPRCEQIDGGVLLNLRVPLAAGEVDAGDPLASLRLWAEPGLLLSASLRRNAVLPAVEARFHEGAMHDPGDVIIAIATAAADMLDHSIAEIGDRVDTLETQIEPSTPFSVRREVTALRSRAIGYRRFVVPQRQALERLAALRLDFIDERERSELLGAADQFARMGEELEAARERAAVLHEELTDLRGEKLDQRSLQVAIVALVFLPLTFLTGLLGMNVEGIPFAKEPWAFWGVTAVCVVMALGVAGFFMQRHWSGGD